MAALALLTGCASKQSVDQETAPPPGKPPICAIESPELCLQDGVDLYFGHARDVDRDAAQSKFELACSGGNQRGCTFLGMMLKDSDDSLAKMRGLELLDQACEAGVPMACAQLGSELFGRAWMKHEAGQEPATQTFQEANARLRKACEMELPEDSVEFWGLSPRGYACGNLAAAYEHGFGVEQDLERALELNRQSCRMDWQRSCAQVGFFLQRGLATDPQPRRAAEIYEDACAQDDAMACANLAGMFVRGEGVEQDRDRAVELYERACSLQFPGACEAAAEISGEDGSS